MEDQNITSPFRFQEPSSPAVPTSARPLPRFFGTETFSTKKDRKSASVKPPPKPKPHSKCPSVSRLFKKRPEINSALTVTFLDSKRYNSLQQIPIQDSSIYDSGKKNSYFEQAFVKERKIGSGCFGNVYRVRSKDTGQLFAVKIAKESFRGPSDRKRKLEEVRKHQFLPPSTNCVQFFQSWEERGRLYQQFELCEKSLGQLCEETHDLPERIIWSYLVDILQAVEHLHDHGLIHMDIKPDNIFIGMDGICKLGDFGLVIDCEKTDTNFQEGDSRYLAAEVIRDNTVTKAVDIFALGATVLEMACDLDLPSHGQLWDDLRFIGPDPKLTAHLSYDLRNVIQMMMDSDWRRRPTAKELLAFPAVERAVKVRARELLINNLVRKLKSFIFPMLVMFLALMSFILKPVLYGLESLKKFMSSRLTPSTSPSHARYVTGWKNSEIKTSRMGVFSSEDEDDDDSVSDSTRSTLATALHFSEDSDESSRLKRLDQLKRFRYGEEDVGDFADDSPQRFRHRPINDFIKSTPGAMFKWESRIPNYTPTSTPKKLDFEGDDMDDSSTSVSSRQFEPDSSFGVFASRRNDDFDYQDGFQSHPVRPQNLATKFDCFSDSDEDN